MRSREDALARRGRGGRVHGRAGPDGEVVAFTEIRVTPRLGERQDTEDTAMVAEHRRKATARAVKLESLRLPAAGSARMSTVDTLNAEANGGDARGQRRGSGSCRWSR